MHARQKNKQMMPQYNRQLAILSITISQIGFILVNVSSFYVSVCIHKHILIHGRCQIWSDAPDTISVLFRGWQKLYVRGTGMFWHRSCQWKQRESGNEYTHACISHPHHLSLSTSTRSVNTVKFANKDHWSRTA